MFSFQTITANNGWAMAFAGALIVMTGLTVLSFIISQLHRLVGVIEKKESASDEKTPDSATAGPPEQFPDDLDEVAILYEPLISQLPADFQLEALFELTKENDFPHAHLTIRAFRDAGKLVAQGEGKFSWNP